MIFITTPCKETFEEITDEHGDPRQGTDRMILVEAHAAGQVGIGFTYGDVSVAHFVESKLKSRVEGQDAERYRIWPSSS